MASSILTRQRVCARALVAFAVVAVVGCHDAPTGPAPAPDPEQPGAARVVGMAMAYGTRCALTETGALFCWGENRFGEFGDGTRTPSDMVVRGGGSKLFTAVYGAGIAPFMCGLSAGNEAWCWGSNPSGELGDGSTTAQSVPTRVAGEHSFAVLSASSHTCGVDVAGKAFCWGSTLGGQLGIGSSECCEQHPVPAAVATSNTFATISNGQQFSCALTTEGAAWCWGWGAGLGSGVADRSVPWPTPVSGDRRYGRISAGSSHVCALDTSSVAWCWGVTGFGWPDEFREGPERVPTSLRFREVTAGQFNGACALTAGGEAWCWRGRDVPVRLPGNRRWSGVVAVPDGFFQEYCGYTPGGSAYCWKWRTEVVNGEQRWALTEPLPIPALPGATTVSSR